MDVPWESVPALIYLSAVVVWAVVLHRGIPVWVHAVAAAVGVAVLAWLGPWWWPVASVLAATVLGVGLVLTAGRHLSRLGLLTLVVSVAVSSLPGVVATTVGLLLGGMFALGVLLRQRGTARALLDVHDMAAAVGVTPSGLVVPDPQRLEQAVSGPRRVRLPLLLLGSQFLGCVVVAGVFGAVTANRKILYVQALPGAVAWVLVWFAR